METDKTWNELKQFGSRHYKAEGSVEPIDLYRAAIPHSSYNAFDVKALTDAIKYAYRLLVRGYSESDADKIIHYISLLKADFKER
jgi:hypothetical protein